MTSEQQQQQQNHRSRRRLTWAQKDERKRRKVLLLLLLLLPRRLFHLDSDHQLELHERRRKRGRKIFYIGGGIKAFVAVIFSMSCYLLNLRIATARK